MIINIIEALSINNIINKFVNIVFIAIASFIHGINENMYKMCIIYKGKG